MTGKKPALPCETAGETPALPFAPFDPDMPTSVSERRLPHWEQAGTMYFITFHLGDSVPQPVLEQWKRERQDWLHRHPEPRTPEQDKGFRRMFSRKMDEYLDSGHGSCLLADPAISGIVEKALLHFDGERYHLGAYVIMPNHVHLLVIPGPGHKPRDILHSWKSFTSKAINKARGTTGNVWQEESYNHIVRSEAQRWHFEEYIRRNPVVAKARPGTSRLGRGSVGELPMNIE
jgi:REP element-mobilizing transposase RayT